MTLRKTMPRLSLVLTGAALVGLGGCAAPIMQSSPVGESSKERIRGLVYALPKAQVELKASRKKVTAKEVAEAKALAEKGAAAVIEAKALKEAAAASVGAMSALHKATLEPGKTEIHKQLTILEAQVSLAVKALAEREATQKAAQNKFEEVKLHEGKWLEMAALTVMPPVPDPDVKARFVATWSGSMTRDDELKLSVAGGMLNTADAIAVDQSAAILVSLAQGVAGTRFQLKSFERSTQRLQPQRPSLDTSRCKAYELVRRFDPTSLTEVAALKAALESAGSADITLDIEPKPTTTTTDTTVTAGEPGVLYRPLVVASMTLGSRTAQDNEAQSCTAAEGESQKSETLVAVVPDSRSTVLLPIEAGMFTKTTHKIVFKDGTPTELSVSSPSQLAAIAGIPIAIARALVSVPAELIKLRVDYDSNSAKILEEQVKQVQQQINLLKAQRLLEAEARKDPVPTTEP